MRRLGAAACRYRDWLQRIEVSLIGRLPVKARMRSPAVVKRQIAADRCPCLGNAFGGMQINLLLIDRPPKALDKNIVPPGTLPSMQMETPPSSSIT
jgi:hypothetical protein